jgi:hypothetical protein
MRSTVTNRDGAFMKALIDDEVVLRLADDNYIPAAVWARKKHITRDTVRRHRRRGLPFLKWANTIWIGERQGEKYLASLVRQRREASLPSEPFYKTRDPAPKAVPPRRRRRSGNSAPSSEPTRCAR